MNFRKLPKIELHCHLDGSVRPETIIDIAKKDKLDLPSYDINEVKKLVTAPLECTSLNEYLTRFTFPIQAMQSKENLKRIAYEVLEDAAKENVKYIEIRFAPLFHTEKGLKVDEVIESVIKGIKEAEEKFDIKGNLILSCLRNMPVESVLNVIEPGRKFLKRGVVAVDLCGPEEAGFCEKFIEPILLAKEYGYRITIHAGETGIGQNVLDAINMLHAERIGHGIFIKDCEDAYKVVKDKGVPLEMCPTSNVQTKATDSIANHPIYDFYKDNIKVTFNTDNRTVSDIDLTNEYEVVSKQHHITYEDYKNIYNNSVEASFADDETKEKLKTYAI